MKDEIRLLPDSVANQIAAGEVIQRPASVVKELVENAVDAGADDIHIIIRDAGRTLIQVIDNGCGMSETDTRMAFERHATSKIKNAADLFSLHTMGFRGEALPSICAVSMVEIRSRRCDMSIGTRLVINGSRVECQEQDVCEKGTNIMVKNLFFNVPARRKFLKSDNVELSNIMKEFERLALVNTGVRMSIDTGVRKLDLKKASFRQRIADLWQSNMANLLLPVEADTSIVKISGFVSRPEHARRRNALQYFIVNGRNMKHPYFHRAVVNCFNSLIANDTQPNYFIKFEVDPASIDVNIHPTKNEIKFEEEAQIWSILSAAVKASLGKNAVVPSIDFEAEALQITPVNGPEDALKPQIEIPTDYNPFEKAISGERKKPADHIDRENVKGWDQLYEGFMSRKGDKVAHGQLQPPSGLSKSDNSRESSLLPDVELPSIICLQFLDKYIVTAFKEELVVIDQYRAHLKILFEQFLAMARNNTSISQSVLFPDSIKIDERQLDLFNEVKSHLNALGFVFENESEGEFLITGIPSSLVDADCKDVILRVLDSVGEGSDAYGNEKIETISDSIRRTAALVMARSAAIVRGRRLTQDEMEKLVGELFRLPDPMFTPNGRRIFTSFDESSFSRLLS